MPSSSLTGPTRLNTWRLELLNLAGTPLGDLDMAKDSGLPGIQPGAQFDRSQNTDLRETAKATLVRAVEDALDWTKYRIRLWYTGEGSDPLTPLATLVPTAAPQTYPSTHVEEALELHSSLTLLAEDGPGGMYGVDAGTNGVAKLTEILTATVGEGKFQIDESDTVLNAGLTWDADTSWLTICNKIATTIGFFSPRPDPFGMVRVERYVDPSQRPNAYLFDDGTHTGLYMPDWTRDQDFLLPNRVVVVQKVEGDATPLQAEAVLPDSNPRSAANIGRTITKTYPDQDFATLEAGQIRAAQLLAGLVPSESRTFQHPWLPRVAPSAVVTHRMTGIPDMTGVVQSQSVKLAVDGLFNTDVTGLL